jgi:hypothetical protein
MRFRSEFLATLTSAATDRVSVNSIKSSIVKAIVSVEFLILGSNRSYPNTPGLLDAADLA